MAINIEAMRAKLEASKNGGNKKQTILNGNHKRYKLFVLFLQRMEIP